MPFRSFLPFYSLKLLSLPSFLTHLTPYVPSIYCIHSWNFAFVCGSYAHVALISLLIYSPPCDIPRFLRNITPHPDFATVSLSPSLLPILVTSIQDVLTRIPLPVTLRINGFRDFVRSNAFSDLILLYRN